MNGHKEVLNRHKAEMLKRAAEYVLETGRNDIPLKTVATDITFYNNFQKMRYHGLIHHYRDAQGNRVRGHWLITKNGWAFRRGEISLPAEVTVRDNAIINRSAQHVHVRDLLRGVDYPAVTFEYEDQYGNPVGVRPVSGMPQQEALL